MGQVISIVQGLLALAMGFVAAAILYRLGEAAVTFVKRIRRH